MKSIQLVKANSIMPSKEVKRSLVFHQISFSVCIYCYRFSKYLV